MGLVVTIEGVTPAPRYDAQPWESVQIAESETAGGTYTLIDTQSLDPVDADPTHPATRNLTTTSATFPRGFYILTFFDALGGSQATDPISVSAELVTLSDLRAYLGIDATDTRKDAQYRQAINFVSKVIANYTERDFGAPLVTEARNFEYDASGFLDIDDAADITEVKFTVPNSTDLVLDAEQWYAAPARRDDSPVFYYIVLTTPLGVSPYMGFTRNADVLYEEGRLPSVTRTAVVSGTWGWPVIPEDVKLAAIWTIQDWTSKPSSENLSAEAIEGYSRAWGKGGPQSASLAIPNRARDLLVGYQKTLV